MPPPPWKGLLGPEQWAGFTPLFVAPRLEVLFLQTPVPKLDGVSKSTSTMLIWNRCSFITTGTGAEWSAGGHFIFICFNISAVPILVGLNFTREITNRLCPFGVMREPNLVKNRNWLFDVRRNNLDLLPCVWSGSRWTQFRRVALGWLWNGMTSLVNHLGKGVTVWLFYGTLANCVQ